jgi:structural maintenance of chromosome 4
VPKLIDLIQPAEERLLSAFYFALRDTLVTNDLDEAVKIAYVGGRAVWRVVTKDGELLLFVIVVA